MTTRRSIWSRGFTLIEVLVAMTLTGIVVAGTLRALSAQKKFYARQARILSARHALRASATLLTSELREVSAAGGDLYAVGSDSVAFRSTAGFGIVCAVNEGSGTLSLTHVSGHLTLDGADSVLVFVENGPQNDDDTWRVLPVVGIATSGPSCGSGTTPQRVITVVGTLNGVWEGAPVRLFRPYVFGLFQMNERWWLGRRSRAASEYLPVAGPLAPPADGGLQLSYYTPNNVATTDPTLVARVVISVRAPTDKTLTEPDYRMLSTSTHLRNGP
ncbi:MAG: type II secretion system protein [Gemmatimonadales bacterium]|jgi:prepilin-type N-terminal cleavage/methylation domain-containing protein